MLSADSVVCCAPGFTQGRSAELSADANSFRSRRITKVPRKHTSNNSNFAEFWGEADGPLFPKAASGRKQPSSSDCQTLSACTPRLRLWPSMSRVGRQLVQAAAVHPMARRTCARVVPTLLDDRRRGTEERRLPPPLMDQSQICHRRSRPQHHQHQPRAYCWLTSHPAIFKP